MAKAYKSPKSKVTLSITIDPDILEKARIKWHQDSIVLKKRVSFSAKMEEIIKEWAYKK